MEIARLHMQNAIEDVVALGCIIKQTKQDVFPELCFARLFQEREIEGFEALLVKKENELKKLALDYANAKWLAYKAEMTKSKTIK